jgi:hypothetical protein
MADILVRRDQFNISPQGIVHKPTDAAFTPYPGDPYSGIRRLGQLSSEHFNAGNGFRPDDVQRMMRELWTQYVTDNRQLFKPAEVGVPIPEPPDSIGRAQIQIDDGVCSKARAGTA